MSKRRNAIVIGIIGVFLYVFLGAPSFKSISDWLLGAIGFAIPTILLILTLRENSPFLLKARTFSSKLWFEVKYTDEAGDVLVAGETPGKIKVPECNSRRFLIHQLADENVDDYVKEIKRKRLKRIIITNAISQALLEKIASSCHQIMIFDFVAGDIADYSCLKELKKLTHLGIDNFSNQSKLPSLKRLKKLESLEIDGGKMLKDISTLSDNPGIVSLVLNNCPLISDISAINSFKKLYHLNLSGLTGLTDISPILLSKDLISLNLCKCNGITDIQAIKYLVKLQELNIEEWDHFSSSLPLEHMAGLKIITANNSKDIKELSWFKNQSQLKTLNLLGCEKLESINAIDCMRNLEVVKFHAARISDFAPLTKLDKLEYLEVAKCHNLGSTEPFSSMPNLKYLELDECNNLTDISSLSRIKNLEQLIITGSEKLEDISALSKLPSLIGINISGGKQIKDISPLSELSSLKYLNMTNCEAVTDISPLSVLRSLLFLDLSGCNRIADLSPLAGLTSLRQLDITEWDNPDCKGPVPYLPELSIINLSKSKITNLDLLSQLTEMVSLCLSECDKLKDISAITTMRKLEMLRLDFCNSLADISPLTKLIYLTYLDLRDNDNLFYIAPLKDMLCLQVLYLGNEKKFHFSDIETICQALPYCKVFIQTNDAKSSEREYGEPQANGET